MSSTTASAPHSTGLRPPSGGVGSEHPIARFADRGHAVLDGLAESPAWTMTPAEQAEVLASLQRLGRRVEELTLRVLAAADHQDVGVDAGAASTAAWLAWRTATERRATHRAVALAHALDARFDATRRALGRGDLDEAQARVIIRAVDALPEEIGAAERRRAEDHLVEEAREHDATALKRLGRHLLEVVAPEEADRLLEQRLADEERAAQRKSYLTLRDNGDGTVEGRFKLPTLHAAMLRKAVDAIASPRRLVNQAVEGDTTTGVPASEGTAPLSASRSERWGAAFGDLLERITQDMLPTYGGAGATVGVTMTLEQLLGRLGVARLDTGEEISAGEARRLACSAGLIPAVLGGASQPLDLGRKRRLHNETQRLAISQRDRTCTAEGCDYPPGWCHVHHDDPWSTGGGTSVQRGRLLCGWHHRKAHDPGYRMTRMSNNRVRFSRRT